MQSTPKAFEFITLTSGGTTMSALMEAADVERCIAWALIEG